MSCSRGAGKKTECIGHLKSRGHSRLTFLSIPQAVTGPKLEAGPVTGSDRKYLKIHKCMTIVVLMMAASTINE